MQNNRSPVEQHAMLTEMRISELRQKFAAHGLLNMISHKIWGADKDIVRLNAFLARFDNEPQHQLTVADTFHLLWLLQIRSPIHSVTELKYWLKNFLGVTTIELIELLARLQLLNQAVYTLICLYPHDKNNVLKLICSLMAAEVKVDHTKLQAILLFCEDVNGLLSEEKVESFVLLMQHNIVNVDVMRLAKSDADIPSLTDVIRALRQLHLLTADNLMHTMQAQDLLWIRNFLKLLADKQITIDVATLQKLNQTSRNKVYSLIKLVPALFEANLLRQDIILLLLDLDALSSLALSLEMRRGNNPLRLDLAILNWLLLLLKQESSLSICADLLSLLSEEAAYYDLIQLIDAHKSLTAIDLTNICNVSSDEIKPLLTFIKGIKLRGVLDVLIIDWVLSVKSPVRLTNDELTTVSAVFDILATHQLLTPNLAFLTTLKPKQLQQFCFMLLNLEHYQVLNQPSLEQACYIVSHKLPLAKPVPTTVTSKKTSNQTRSMLIAENQPTIYLENAKEGSTTCEGSFGKVKKAYANLDDAQPRFAVKKPKSSNQFLQMGFKAWPEQQCKREVKYAHLLDRYGFYFIHKNQPRSVTNWLHGSALYDLTPNQIRSQPLLVRLKWFTSALSELNVLHENYRVHNDIKTDNLILDEEKQALRLIDFGLSGRPDCFGNSYKHFFFEVGDMGGRVLPVIFPDILSNAKQPDLLVTAPHLVNAIIRLQLAMTHKETSVRCHCSDALVYCRELLDIELNVDAVQALAERTIERKDKTVAGILHEYNIPKSDKIRCAVM